MRMFRTYLLCLFTIAIVLVQCDKPPIIPRKNVYVTGMEFHYYGTDSAYTIAKLWVNGVATDLSRKPDMAEPRSIAVSGKDVYVAGTTYSFTKPSRATLWKNKVATYLGGDDSQAFSVSISGKDVYVSGSIFINGKIFGVVWKNGVVYYQSDDYLFFWNIFASNKDLFSTGSIFVNGKWEQTVFKNQQPLYQSLSPKTSELTSVFVSGNDVYTTGVSDDYVVGNFAYVWKNGVPTRLSTTSASANDVFVSGKDVYVTGFSTGGCSLWKNGQLLPMEHSISSEGYSVFVSGKDAYVAGTAFIEANNYSEVPALWKNGKLTLLPINSKTGFATSVCAD
ncbi:hypothetical protein [Lacibacter sp.]|uniref:hypothetical protein n=1 Tax=Lacibacter sp. TaxID=1915409 RepID=UPI002B4AD4FB|nr:hypothetical protein [Lacibacter sp.]HLP39506.1 hypothetical protein [Lacibacter sp.]